MKAASLFKFLCITLALIFAIVLVRPASNADETNFEGQAQDAVAHFDLINKFCDYINAGDWVSWANLYTPIERADRLSLVTNSTNFDQNIGILTINHIEVLEINRVPNSNAPWVYTELRSYYENEANYACYRILIETSVNVDNGYYSNGTEYQLMVLIKHDNEWGIGVMCECPSDLIPGNETMHLNPYYEIKSQKYDNVSAIFPNVYSEQNSNKSVNMIKNFTVSFLLPKGWSYRENTPTNEYYLGAFTDDLKFDHSLIYIYNNYNACVGAIGYSEYPSDKFLFSTNGKEIFYDYYKGSDFNFAIYEDCLEVTHQIESPAANLTFITTSFHSSSLLAEHGIELSDRVNPAILSCEDSLRVFVAFEFDVRYISSIELLDIAESIRITPVS